MKNIILAGTLGGLILWVWGFLSWVVLPLHDATMRELPDEAGTVAMLAQSLPEAGVYVFPKMPGGSGESGDAAMAEYVAKLRSGPTGMLFYDTAGKDPFMVNQMVVGLLIFIVAAGIVAWLLSRSTASAGPFLSRVVYCGVVGILVAVGTHLSEWNWMGDPFDWTRAQMIDSIAGWLLAGAGIAAVIRPAKGS